jgi:hypothetical protein
MTHTNREEWLTAALEEIRPLLSLPAAIRVTCGFPLTFKRTGNLGEAYPASSSGDKTIEVLIAPTIADPVQVFTVLFDTLKGVSAGGGDQGDCSALIDSFGPYPHAAITIATRKPQTARMLKASCPTCGMIIRLTAKWAHQLPTCSADGDSFIADEVTE